MLTRATNLVHDCYMGYICMYIILCTYIISVESSYVVKYIILYNVYACTRMSHIQHCV